MPSSLIIVALVVAWLVVLVPMMARKRQESARSVGEEYDAMPDAEYDDIHDIDDDYFDEEEYVERPFRRGRGGYDPETAALVAQAKYAFRRRVVAFLLVAAVAYVVMGIRALEHIVFVFPELLLLVIGAALLAGRYTGYRLLELRRFKALLPARGAG